VKTVRPKLKTGNSEVSEFFAALILQIRQETSRIMPIMPPAFLLVTSTNSTLILISIHAKSFGHISKISTINFLLYNLQNRNQHNPLIGKL